MKKKRVVKKRERDFLFNTIEKRGPMLRELSAFVNCDEKDQLHLQSDEIGHPFLEDVR
jgi:hypothetical protein